MSVVVSDETIEPASVRYHGLDALRAWAMSMGIVLHAAWIMIPAESGAPMTDASASSVTEYICLAIHTFRMQLFFVLAGLFACLLLRKRGLVSFAKNRVMRILLPMVVFWMILCPIMMWQINAGGIASGAIQGDVTAWELTKAYFANLGPGSVVLLHLWFLYYLCWAIVVVISVRGILLMVDRNGHRGDFVSAKFGAMISSPWSVLILAFVFGAMMFPMDGNVGIQIEYASLYPWRKWPGLLTYVSYFVAGWLIFRNIDKLSLMLRAWRWQLALGVMLTVPYFFYFRYASENGYSTSEYPQLVVEDFRFKDGEPVYTEFRDRLLSSDEGTIAGTLYASLPEANQKFLKEHVVATQNQLNGLLVVINRGVLGTTAFTEKIASQEEGLAGQAAMVAAIAPTDRTEKQNQVLNRALINSGFKGILYSEDVNRPYYYPIRAAYCFFYSLTTWLLIFGCIGFSQHHFDRESRFWRYFSDSSYWFYLAHLPIQFQILLWVGDKPWNPVLKFAVYVFGTIAVLLPSYHFLIRPSWIGWLLNGRMSSVWKRPAKIQEDPVSSPGGASATETLRRIDGDPVAPPRPIEPQTNEEEEVVSK